MGHNWWTRQHGDVLQTSVPLFPVSSWPAVRLTFESFCWNRVVFTEENHKKSECQSALCRYRSSQFSTQHRVCGILEQSDVIPKIFHSSTFSEGEDALFFLLQLFSSNLTYLSVYETFPDHTIFSSCPARKTRFSTFLASEAATNANKTLVLLSSLSNPLHCY